MAQVTQSESGVLARELHLAAEGKVVWVRVPPPVPFPENQRLSSFVFPENAPSFNKSFNTSPRVSLVLNASHHAIERGDGARSLPAVAMVIPQIEGGPRCFFQA